MYPRLCRKNLDTNGLYGEHTAPSASAPNRFGPDVSFESTMSVDLPSDIGRVGVEERDAAASGNPSHLTLVITDRSQIMIEGIKQVFTSEPGFRVLATCWEEQQIPQTVHAHHPDVLVLSMSAGRREFRILETLHACRDKTPLKTRTILLTDSLDEDDTLRAMQLGVSAVVLRDMPPAVFVRCIKKVHAGGRWVEHSSIGKVVERLLRREAAAIEVARALTRREAEIMRLLAAGLTNLQIAGRIHVSDGTVKTHLHHIYKKLKVKGRLQLTLHARDRGWV